MEVLRVWLEDTGIESHNLEQDFSNGYLFGKLLQAYGLQPDLHAFQNKGKPDAYLNNYMRLQPTLSKLGVQLDTRKAQALINKEPGLAGKVLLSIKQQLEGLATNLQSSAHASRRMQQCTVRTSPSRGLLEAQQHKSQYAALDASNSKFFEDVLRKNSSSPNKLMESLHLRRFADEGSRQAASAAEAAAAASAAQAATRNAFREGLKCKMSSGRADKATKLQRDEAVHAAILRHQDDLERQELRVELALAELGCQRHQDQRRAAAADAATGIDAFEMTLKRLGATGSSGLEDQPGPAAGESPMTTLGRIRSFAPTAAKLADSKADYLTAIKARRQEEAAARKEREGRRRRMLVEQQAARTAAEGRVEADCLLEVLVRRSTEEQKLAQHLWQLQQEKAAMEAGRRLREEQYAALKDKEWEDTLRREAEIHRSLHVQHRAEVEHELAAWRAQRDAQAQAAATGRKGFARDTAWQLVQLAERVVEFRAATGGQAVPLADWRAWLSLFLAGDPALGSPVVSSDPAGLQDPPSTKLVINTAELQDYLTCQGPWAPDATTTAPSGAGGVTSSTGSRPGTANGLQAGPQANLALGEVVAELARLAQKLRATQPQLLTKPLEQQEAPEQGALQEADGGECRANASAGVQPPVLSAAEAAAGSGAAPGADIIRSIPLKLAVVGAPFSGKSTVAHTLAHAFGLKLLVPEQLVNQAIAAARDWHQQQQQQDPQESAAQGLPQEPVPAKDAPSHTTGAPLLVGLGLDAAAQMESGQAVSDNVLVQLLVLAMQEAKAYTPPPIDPAQPEAPAKAGKAAATKAAAGAKSESGAASAAGGRHNSSSGSTAGAGAGSTVLGVAAAMAAGLGAVGPGPALPPSLAPGASGRGFVLDGFPSTQQQAELLERALTGLDLVAEQELVQGTSLISPPPASVLPQLQRPLLSGLDAVLLLGCADEAAALTRVLGRRQDPVTGQLYHLDFDPPPGNNPGRCERLVQPSDQEVQASKVHERLAAWASHSPALESWLGSFSSLRRPLDSCLPLSEVLGAAGDVVCGLLTAKGAAQAAQAAAAAAQAAQANAEQAQALSRASQLHAEAAARDLLTTKKAELQVLPLLAGGKNPDPSAAEMLKAQAAVKCAEQLKVCLAAASEVAAQASAAQAAAAAAAAAVLDCKKSVGDAAVSADAQALASKAAADAEAAAAAAITAADKAQAAKQTSDGYAQDAEKWAGAADVPLDATIAAAQPAAAPAPPAQAATAAPAAPARPASGRPSTAAAPSAKPNGGPSSLQPAAAPPAVLAPRSSSELSLRPAGSLPAPLALSLHEEWTVLEHSYIEGMGRGLTGLRGVHSLAVSQVAANRSWFAALLSQPDNRQQLLQEFVSRFNAVELDMRKADETKGELLLRCEELRDALWALCDARHEAAEAARLKLAHDGAAAQHVGLLGQQLTSLVQVELDRFVATAQFLWSYCHSTHGVHHMTAASKVFASINVLSGPGVDGSSSSSSKADQGRASQVGAAGVGCSAALQQRLPQLASALRAAVTGATAAQTAALSMVAELQQKAAAAAAHAAATASAAAAAATAAGQPASSAAGHRQVPAPGAKAAAGGGAAAGPAGGPGGNSKAASAASSKLAANSEEASAVAAAAAAAAAALPDPAVLAALHAELQAALCLELSLLQQRLAALTRRASTVVEEVVALHAATHSQLAEQSHRQYVAECSAVAALERVVKEAAAAGKPLAHDLRLEETVLVVDCSQQLVPPPLEPPPPRPATPLPPPGVLTMEQLAAVAAAFQAAQLPAGYLAVQAAVELMTSLASQDVLPSHWCDLSDSQVAAALAAFDPTYSGYLDWRELLLALAAAALPALHTASPAQLAAQALQLAAADGDGDGCLTCTEFDGVSWWFEPRHEVLEQATDSPSQQADVLQEARSCHAFKQLLWDCFKQPAGTSSSPADAAQQLGSSAVLPAGSAPTGAGSRPASASTGAGGAATAGGEAVYVVPAQALLLYLCADRDLYAGITKAVSVVAQRAGSGVAISARGVLDMCYPLLQPQQAAPVCRAPLNSQQVLAAVAAATASRAGTPPAAASSGGSAAAAKGSSTGGAASRKPSSPGYAAAAPGADAQAAGVLDAAATVIKPAQLMYSAACERIVSLLLHRYQWKDVYVAAML